MAPVRCGRPRPQLRLVEHADDRSPPAATQHSRHNSNHAFRRRCWPGARRPTTPDRVAAYQKVNQYLAEDIPYLWLARDTWAVVANPKVQNFANPTTMQGSKAVAFDEGVLWPAQMWVSD